MAGRGTIVVDIGKTNAKLSLWSPAGDLIDRVVRANTGCMSSAGYRALDVGGIDAWLIESLSAFARHGAVDQLVPVAHGAAAALVRGGSLFADPMDYEEPIAADSRKAYERNRDPFSQTGSPALPCGLNLGVQLHRLEELLGPIPRDVTILPWPQYWAWRLSGRAASEVTSLGCHSDLWFPAKSDFSTLARTRGWAEKMAPTRPAGATLGALSADLAARTGLNRDCRVLCGLHDSNAALLAARGHDEIEGHDATVLSTGTWFVAMRTPAEGSTFQPDRLPEAQDCLVNVDIAGRPIPSARFMGGREFELISGLSSFDLDKPVDASSKLGRVPAILEAGACAFPSFVDGVGPFPAAAGRWHKRPAEAIDRLVAAELYLALMADAALDLIGSREHLLIEGRFAHSVVFVRTLAALRAGQRLYTSHADHDVACGALRLVDPARAPASGLDVVQALEWDVREYASHWRKQAMTTGPDT